MAEKIKTIRKEVASLLAADSEVTTTLQTHIYNSRQLPGTFDRELCVFSLGTLPGRTRVLGDNPKGPAFYIAIIWLIKFDQNELATAEDVSDDLEDAIYRIFLDENYKHTYWRKVTFPNFSIRPLAPGGTQNAHFGRTTLMINPQV